MIVCEMHCSRAPPATPSAAGIYLVRDVQQTECGSDSGSGGDVHGCGWRPLTCGALYGRRAGGRAVVAQGANGGACGGGEAGQRAVAARRAGALLRRGGGLRAVVPRVAEPCAAAIAIGKTQQRAAGSRAESRTEQSNITSTQRNEQTNK